MTKGRPRAGLFVCPLPSAAIATNPTFDARPSREPVPCQDPRVSRLVLEIAFSKNYPLMIRCEHWKSPPVLTMFQRQSIGVCRGIPGDMRLNAARCLRAWECRYG
jgi:hypothetical protein